MFGKLYQDTIYNFPEFRIGETNNCNPKDSLGGVYNIPCSMMDISTSILTEGVKKAVIINDLQKSIRTSIVYDESNTELCPIDFLKSDWVHVAYIDDIFAPDRFLEYPNLSLDFCTENPRGKFIPLINNSQIIFDSRERQHLYSHIKSPTPIIFHDPHGCECIVNGESIYKTSIYPTIGLKVNGAGDIFAGLFLDMLLKSGLEYAVNNACFKTTEILLKLNEEI